jgi:peptidoglycan/LPS O-acetylase OafA/YrhL
MGQPPEFRKLNNEVELHKLSYRPDIDGLRALAVITVVIYHAFPIVAKGGFIGVDVFLVISGYLITGIIFKNLHEGNFSIVKFYQSRIRRIFPALLAVLTACFIFGWFFLLGNETKQLTKHISASSAFLMNIVLWMESGYFDTNSKNKILLHLWSLGVEEQFYIFWPLMLWISAKLGFKTLKVCCVLAVISFGWSFHLVLHDQVAAYYSPLSRFWELSLGGILATIKAGKRNSDWSWPFPRYNAALGGGLILASSLIIDEHDTFPGPLALLPALGAMLVISSPSSSSFSRRVFGHPLAVALGKISYPLYLWHWPLLAALSIRYENVTAMDRLSAVLFAILLAILTYWLIERPARFGRFANSSWKVSLASMTVVFLGSLTLSRLDAFPLAPPNALEIGLTRAMSAEDQLRKAENCFLYDKDTISAEQFISRRCFNVQNSNRKTVFLLGDSHSASLGQGLRPTLIKQGFNFIQLSTGWCEPMSREGAVPNCASIEALARDIISRTHPDLLVLDAHWMGASRPPYFKSEGKFQVFLSEKIDQYRHLGAQNVMIIGQIPTWKGILPNLLIKNYVRSRKEIPERTYDNINRDSLAIDSLMSAISFPANVRYLSLKDKMCNDQGCLTAVGPDWERDVIVWDYGHLTQSASRYVSERIVAPAIHNLLRP